MYHYNSLILICSIFILTVRIKSQDSKGPGMSSCCFFGERTEADCGLSDVLITDIPEKCTSVIYSKVYMDLNYNATNSRSTNDFTTLDNMLKSGKRVIIHYVHDTEEEWTTILACHSSNEGNNSFDEMKALKGFFDAHPKIAGVILTGLQNQENSKGIPGLSENLKKYLELMKKTFPELEVGIHLYGNLLIDQYTDLKIEWLTITEIDPCMDFYVISLEFFNECDATLRNTGTIPMNGSETYYTLEKLKNVLQKASIPREKIYFKFTTHPVSNDYTSTICQVNNEKMCTDPKVACDWCADTQLSYNEKGKYSADNGAGFMVRFIDYDDPHKCCQCETPYPAFNAILDGFNGVTTKSCNLLNRS